MCGLLRVRKEMGLKNVKVMIPFCRTVDEGRRVISEMASHGLRQGEDGLEIYAMCELPSNVVLAAEFLEVFDGFSIGSNDLTQLVLGIDRDSGTVSHLFDERNGAVLRMIEAAIDAAHRAHKADRNLRPGAIGLSGVRSLARRQEDSFDFPESGCRDQDSADCCEGGG